MGSRKGERLRERLDIGVPWRRFLWRAALGVAVVSPVIGSKSKPNWLDDVVREQRAAWGQPLGDWGGHVVEVLAWCAPAIAVAWLWAWDNYMVMGDRHPEGSVLAGFAMWAPAGMLAYIVLRLTGMDSLFAAQISFWGTWWIVAKALREVHIGKLDDGEVQAGR